MYSLRQKYKKNKYYSIINKQCIIYNFIYKIRETQLTET